MDITDRQARIIIAALTRFSHDFEDADPELADDAWELAVAIADERGLDPADAARGLR